MSASVVSRLRYVSVLLVTLTLFVAIPAVPTAAGPIDAEAELRVVKTAYDALRKNLYTEPDTVALLTNAHHEAQATLDQSLPLDPLDGNADQQWEVFAQNVRTMVAQSSVTRLAPGDLAHRLVANMANTVNDLHTYFLAPKDADTTRRKDSGDTSIVNFGFTSVNVNGDLYIKQVLPGSPIDEAGARNGDHVLAVDGQPLNAGNRTVLLGSPQEGQTYDLTVQHAAAVSATELLVHMHRYVRAALAYRVLDGHIGYIQTFSFYTDIPQELDDALAALHGQNVDSLILDLRGNPGGTNLDRVMGRFLPSGTELGVMKGRWGQAKVVARAEGHGQETLPVVVLVDEGSGSASEIAALAFRDFTQATIVGTRTAGAIGSTARFDLHDGSALSITIAVYTAAKGEALNSIGVTPDTVVSQSNDDLLAGRDPQLAAAVMAADAKVTPASFLPFLAA